MIINAPIFVSTTFILTTILTLYLFYGILKQATPKYSNLMLIVMVIWLLIQGALAYYGVYRSDLDSFPPKFPFSVLPTLIMIAYLFISSKGKDFIDRLSLEKITWLNIVRIPVEIILYWLFVYKMVPELMTFSGRNFDIIAGVTAPFVAYFGISKKMMSRRLLLGWNIIALVLLLFIVVNALLSTPFAFQQFGFDQPNIAILNFPFIWLPTFIVPTVLFGHLVSIRRLWKKDSLY